MLGEQLKAALLLVGVAEDAYVNNRRSHVARHVHVVDGDQAGFVDVELAADGFTDLLLEQFADSLDSEAGNKSKGINGFLDAWIVEASSTAACFNPFIHQSKNPTVLLHNFAANFSIA